MVTVGELKKWVSSLRDEDTISLHEDGYWYAITQSLIADGTPNHPELIIGDRVSDDAGDDL